MTVKRGSGDRLAQARRMKAVREWRDITRADVARAVGVDNSTISVWESGKLPNDDRLAAVCVFLGVSPAWVRYGVEAPLSGEGGQPGPSGVRKRPRNPVSDLTGTGKATPKQGGRKR